MQMLIQNKLQRSYLQLFYGRAVSHKLMKIPRIFQPWEIKTYFNSFNPHFPLLYPLFLLINRLIDYDESALPPGKLLWQQDILVSRTSLATD